MSTVVEVSEPVRERDKYDEAIEYLTAHPEAIAWAWMAPLKAPGGCLFQFATQSGYAVGGGRCCGCLTTIKSGIHVACNDFLTDAIRADERIPLSHLVTFEHLPIFADWQRRIDAILDRK